MGEQRYPAWRVSWRPAWRKGSGAWNTFPEVIEAPTRDSAINYVAYEIDARGDDTEFRARRVGPVI